MDDHHRQRYGKRCTLIDTIAGGGDGASMQFGEVLGNGEPEPEAAVVTRERRVRLAEAFKYVWQEVGRDTSTRVADGDFDVRVDACQAQLHLAALRRELNGVRQEIPDELLQAVGIA